MSSPYSKEEKSGFLQKRRNQGLFGRKSYDTYYCVLQSTERNGDNPGSSVLFFFEDQIQSPINTSLAVDKVTLPQNYSNVASADPKDSKKFVLRTLDGSDLHLATDDAAASVAWMTAINTVEDKRRRRYERRQLRVQEAEQAAREEAKRVADVEEQERKDESELEIFGEHKEKNESSTSFEDSETTKRLRRSRSRPNKVSPDHPLMKVIRSHSRSGSSGTEPLQRKGRSKRRSVRDVFAGDDVKDEETISEVKKHVLKTSSRKESMRRLLRAEEQQEKEQLFQEAREMLMTQERVMISLPDKPVMIRMKRAQNNYLVCSKINMNNKEEVIESTFRIIPGLSNPEKCISIQGVGKQFKHLIVRHEGINKPLKGDSKGDTESSGLSKDSAFRVVPPSDVVLQTRTPNVQLPVHWIDDETLICLESVNKLGHFVRSFNQQLILQKLDGTQQFLEDVVFRVVPAPRKKA